MQKETVRRIKLSKLSKFEILIRNLRKKCGYQEKFITWSNLNLLTLVFCKHPNFISVKRIINTKQYYFLNANF